MFKRSSQVRSLGNLLEHSAAVVGNSWLEAILRRAEVLRGL